MGALGESIPYQVEKKSTDTKEPTVICTVQILPEPRPKSGGLRDNAAQARPARIHCSLDLQVRIVFTRVVKRKEI